MKLSLRWLAASVLLLAAACVSFPSANGQDAKATAAADSKYQVPETDEGLPGAGPIRRADWFKKLWAQRRSAWGGRAQQDQGAVVFLGDSITQGWGDNLGGAFGGLKVANRGISGDTSRGVLVR